MPSKHGLLLAVTLCVVALAGLSGVAAETPTSGFDVEITDANTTVTAGDPVVVTATVRNTGSETDSQQIHLKNVDDEIADSVARPPLSLTPGESETVQLVWTTTADDIGNGTISVQSNDDYPKRELTVLAAPTVETTVDPVNTSMDVGETVTVPVSVENTGETQATSTVWLALNGSETSNQTVTVDPGATERVNLTWTPTADDAGSWTLTAGTDDDHTNYSITVNQSAEPTAPTTDEPRVTDRSSGGGGSPPNVRDRMQARVTGTTATFPGGDIRRITFETEPIAGDVVATRYADRPAGVERAADAVGYYGIELPDDATGHNATIRFHLSAQTLDSEESQRIGGRQWNGTGWESRPTTVSNQSTERTVVDVEASQVGSDGDAVFAVTVGDTPDSLASTTADREPTPESDGQPNGTSGAVTADPLINTTGGLGAVLVFGAASLLMGSRYRFRNA